MKVVMAGASGTGKTTLAQWVSKQYELPFVENSAGLIMQDRLKRRLRESYGYNGDWGQVKVINESTSMPDFGLSFQRYILESRTELIRNAGQGVFDRSPLDPYVFFMNQCVHNQSQQISADFIYNCFEALMAKTTGITHLIYVPLLNPNKSIENNGSRSHNYYFQKKINSLFQLGLDHLLEYANSRDEILFKTKYTELKCLRIADWDWAKRTQQVKTFLDA